MKGATIHLEYTSIPVNEVLYNEDFELLDRDDYDLMTLLRGTNVRAVVENGQILGYMILDDYPDHQELLFMEVQEKHRRRGIGEGLLRHFLDNSKPLRLSPLDSTSLEFFVRMGIKGVVPKLQIDCSLSDIKKLSPPISQMVWDAFWFHPSWISFRMNPRFGLRFGGPTPKDLVTDQIILDEFVSEVPSRANASLSGSNFKEPEK